MPILIETDESRNPLTTGTYEQDRVPQGFKAPDRFGRMRPNRFAGAKIGGGYDAPQGTPTWTPTLDRTSGITHPDPGRHQVTNAGITNRNLNGYKVMNALSIDPSADDFFLRELFNYGKRYFPGYDAENDEWRQKKYRDSLKKANPLEGALQGGMTGEFYPDKILRDLYPQAFGGQAPYTTDEELNDILENLSPEDLGMTEQLEAQSQWKRPENMEKTIRALKLRPEFEDWTDEAIKNWLYNTARANRGGLMSLV